MPALRLPLELELHILELATPPLLFDRVRRRVYCLRQVALVHRSFTKWAQDKLHEQFVFTLRGHAGEQKRLEWRLTAGFGSPSSGTLSRLYLDLRAWDEDGNWNIQCLGKLLDHDSDEEYGVPLGRPRANANGDEADKPWNPCDTLRPWLSALASVWFLIPCWISWDSPRHCFAGARYLECDDLAWSEMPCHDLPTVLPTRLTTLVLRDVSVEDNMPTLPNLQRLALITSVLWLEAAIITSCLPSLDILESIASQPSFHPKHLPLISPTVRMARFYNATCPTPDEEADLVSLAEETPPRVPQRLEECSFTWLNAPPFSAITAQPLEILQGAVVAAISNNSVTVQCLRSEATEEETIERILEELVV